MKRRKRKASRQPLQAHPRPTSRLRSGGEATAAVADAVVVEACAPRKISPETEGHTPTRKRENNRRKDPATFLRISQLLTRVASAGRSPAVNGTKVANESGSSPDDFRGEALSLLPRFCVAPAILPAKRRDDERTPAGLPAPHRSNL